MSTNDDDRKIDFSALDPARDARRWEARIASIVERAITRRPSVRTQLVAWARPILAFAAAVTLVMSSVAVALRPRSAASVRDPAAALIAWAEADQVPSASEVFLTFGGSDGH